MTQIVLCGIAAIRDIVGLSCNIVRTVMVRLTKTVKTT